MVHKQLIQEGRTKQLTFRQLKTLERIDAKKAREEKLLDLVKEGIIAGGRGAQGIFSNQIAGTILFLLILATDPELLAAAYQNLSEAATILGDALIRALPGTQGSGVPKDPNGKFCIRLHALIGGRVLEACYSSAQLRDQALLFWSNRISGRAEGFNKE